MSDMSCHIVNQLQNFLARFPQLRLREWEAIKSRPPLRALMAAVLAAATFTLAVWAGPDLIGHLLGAGDADHCTVCAAVHGMRAGARTAPVVLVPALLLVGPPSLLGQLSLPAVATSTPSSRAPPVVG